MRLALTHAYSWPDVRRGGERILHELSTALAHRGHAVTVFSTGSSPGRTREDGVVTIRFGARYEAGEYEHERHFASRLMRALAARRFDCVHSLGPHDAVASIRIARLTRHRTVYTNLGNPIRTWWEAQPGRDAHDRVVRDVDAYGCLSNFGLRALERDYGRAGVLTPGGVDLRQFAPAEGREPDPTILFSGALNEPRKGLAVLVQAFELLLPSEPRARLWLSGPGDVEDLLSGVSAVARDRIQVLPLGDPRGQAERYGRAWVSAVPSLHEAFGLVVLESFACGTPVVAAEGWAAPIPDRKSVV